MYTECFLCHQYCDTEKHHIFGGALRKKSEKYKLTVQLCPYCHRDNKEGVHNNREKMQALHEYGQRKAMEEHGWISCGRRRRKKPCLSFPSQPFS